MKKHQNSIYSGNGDERDDVSTPEFDQEMKVNKEKNLFKKKKNFSTDIENETECFRKKQLESLAKESNSQSDKLFFKLYANLTCSEHESN